MSSAAEDSLVGQKVGNYRVTRVLGTGGMGSVYELVHRELGRKQALKALHADFLERRDIVDRFFAEAIAVNAIGHASIVDIIDTGELLDGRPYLLMEYLSGQSLAELLERRGALPTKRACELMSTVCSALDAAHRVGITHRDLKPDNLFICDSGAVKLLDFGIAKLTGALRRGDFPTLTGDLLGTPQYMAPEQATGRVRAIGPHTDVYALGTVLYELLAGRPPFAGSNLADLVVQQVQGTPPPITDYRRDLSPAWTAVVERAMAKDPEDRFATAGELALAADMAEAGVTPAATAHATDRTRLADDSATPVTIALGRAIELGERNRTPKLPAPLLPSETPVKGTRARTLLVATIVLGLAVFAGWLVLSRVG